MTGADITCQVCEARIDVGADICPECGARTDIAAALREDRPGTGDGGATSGDDPSGEPGADTGADDTDGATASTGVAASCPDCGASVSVRAVRCPDCYTALTDSGSGASGGTESGDRSAGYRHVALVPLMFAGATGVTASVAFPETAGVSAVAGALNLLNIIGIPLVTYLDLHRVTAAVDWAPRAEVWVLLGVVPAVNVVSAFLYLVRRADALGTAV